MHKRAETFPKGSFDHQPSATTTHTPFAYQAYRMRRLNLVTVGVRACVGGSVRGGPLSPKAASWPRDSKPANMFWVPPQA